METVKHIISRRTVNVERMEKTAPDLFHGFNEMMKYYYKPGTLSRREKELMALAVSVAVRCTPCMAVHLANAVAAGGTREQALEAAAIGVEFGGGPSFVVVREQFLDMVDEIAGETARRE